MLAHVPHVPLPRRTESCIFTIVCGGTQYLIASVFSLDYKLHKDKDCVFPGPST